MKQKWSAAMILLTALGVSVFIVVVSLGERLATGNVQILQMMVTAFSVMTGVLLAIITVSGDPSLLRRGSAALAHVQIAQIDNAMHRYTCLFYIFLLTVVAGLVTATLIHVNPCTAIAHWFERCTLGLGAMALTWSFGLPRAMVKIHRRRLTDEQKRREDKEKPVLPDEAPF